MSAGTDELQAMREPRSDEERAAVANDVGPHAAPQLQPLGEASSEEHLTELVGRRAARPGGGVAQLALKRARCHGCRPIRKSRPVGGNLRVGRGDDAQQTREEKNDDGKGKRRFMSEELF